MQEDDEQADSDKETNQGDAGSGNESANREEQSQNENDDYDYDKKSDTAEDFSEINELAEDLQSAMMPEKARTTTGDNYDDVDEKPATDAAKDEPLSKDGEESSDQKSASTVDESKSGDTDKELMPPPSIPVKSTARYSRA